MSALMMLCGGTVAPPRVVTVRKDVACDGVGKAADDEVCITARRVVPPLRMLSMMLLLRSCEPLNQLPRHCTTATAATRVVASAAATPVV